MQVLPRSLSSLAPAVAIAGWLGVLMIPMLHKPTHQTK